MNKSIPSIRLTKRFRKELGNLDSLAKSIKSVGLLHPIVIQPDGTLIAGKRRLEACKLLGWKTIPVNVIDLEQIARGEHDENTERKDFLPSEIEAIRKAIGGIKKQEAKERQRAGGGEGGRKEKGSKQCSAESKQGSANFAEPYSPKEKKKSQSESRAAVAKATGVSHESVRKISIVHEAAEKDPNKFGDLPEAMDRKEISVDAAYQKVRRTSPKSKTANKALTSYIKKIIKLLEEAREICYLKPPLGWAEKSLSRTINKLKEM